MRFHDVQIVIDPECEHADEGIEQIGVLPSEVTVDGLDRIALNLELLDDREKLDDPRVGCRRGSDLLVALAARPESLQRHTSNPRSPRTETGRRGGVSGTVTVQVPVPHSRRPSSPQRSSRPRGVAVRVTTEPLS